MKNIILLSTLLFLMLSSSCSFLSTMNLKEVDLDRSEKLIEMSKGPCYGRCPVYTFTVYANGVMTYEGKRFTNREGLYIKKMSDSDLKALKTDLKAANLRQYRDAYRARLTDLQSVSITYYEADFIKTIIGKDGRPEKVVEIQGELERFADSEDWQLRSKGGDDLPDHIVNNELRVSLQDNVDVYAWVRKYRKQGMSVIQNMSTSNNLWLVEFNAEKNDSREVLAIIQADLEVASAEFNRKSTK